MSFEAYLETLFPSSNTLYQACRYALLQGGKRLRPKLLFAFFSEEKEAYPAASALELVHTYSLIHDDLPCMDNDDERRGKPSVHKAFSETVALLAGDLLLTKAFEQISLHQNAELVTLLASFAGDRGMIGGQWLDLSLQGSAVEQQVLKEIHEKKTGALFQAALLLGHKLSGKGEKTTLERLGSLLGLYYQLNNDLKDPEERGSDQKLAKATALSVLGKKNTFLYLQNLEEEIKNLLETSTLPSLDRLIHTAFFTHCHALTP